MDSSRTKVAIFVLIVLALGACLGLALMKFSAGMSDPAEFSKLTPEQKLQRIEKSTLNTDRTRALIDRSLTRTQDTKAAEDAVYGGK